MNAINNSINISINNNNNHNIDNNHTNGIYNNGITHQTHQSFDETSLPPKNERELWEAFHSQCATIHSLEVQITDKDKRIKELEELLSRMGYDGQHIY
ncbi:unnamed protein product [Medioppia subpectinata]|nr:unnamed protein product [Medioppia subpectinata]CAG2123273.1 unnamed protein product [Medioppia subpectinata]